MPHAASSASSSATPTPSAWYRCRRKWFETDSHKDVREIDVLEDKRSDDPFQLRPAQGPQGTDHPRPVAGPSG